MAMAKASKETTKDAPVSFTDTMAETGATGLKAQTSSNMMDLIGTLKKEQAQQEKQRSDEEGGEIEKYKKKQKHKKKGKYNYKMKRGKDKYESDNYLFRVEGAPCCATLIVLGMSFAVILTCLLVIIAITKGKINALFNKQPKDS